MKPKFVLKSSRSTRRSLLSTASRNRIGMVGAIAGTALLGVSSGLADEFWVGDTSADWNTASNWSNDTLPAGQWTVVNAGSPHTALISADSAFTPTDLGVGRGAGQTGRLDHTAGTAQTGGGNWLWVGTDQGNGTYNLADTAGSGGTLTGYGTGFGTMNAQSAMQIGATGGIGTVNVNTTGALNVSGDLRIVDLNTNGTGTLNVDAGTVSVGGNIQVAKVSGGTGNLNVSGGNVSGKELRVGYGGATGTVNLSGGAFATDGWTTFGGGGSTGNLNVSGGTFTVLNDALIIADNGSSTLAQTGGEMVLNGQFFVGQGSGNGTQNFSLGTMTTNNWAVVGREGGTGITNMSGGTWNHNAAGGTHIVIATTNAASVGTVNLSGGLMNVQSAAVEVGEWGNGTMTVSNTAELRSGEIRVGLNLGASGTLNLNGGTLRTHRISGLNREGTDGAGNSTVNFNGTQIIASADDAGFISNLNTAAIQTGGLKIDSNGFDLAGNQALSGTGGIVKSGEGAVSLLGAHTYSGSNLVQAGHLTLPNHATGTGGIQVNAGASLGIEEFAYNSQISPSSVTFDAASTLDFSFTDIGGVIQTSAPLNTTGNLALGGDLTINVADLQTEIGTLPLISYASKSGAGAPVLGLLPENVSGTLQDNGSLISIDITSNAPLAWDGDTDQWNLAATNWYDEETSTDDVAFTDGRWVNFDDLATGTTNVVLDGVTVSPGGTLFENDSFDFTLSGTGSIGGTGRLIKRGDALTTISNANTYTGLTRIEDGILSIPVIANGGAASPIGQSSSAPENLVFAGGTLNYTGASATSDRGFVTTAVLGGIGTNNDLTLTGAASTTGGNFHKSGAGNLTLAHNGPNSFGGGAIDGINVLAGTLTLDGSGGSQTNNVTGDIWVGTALTSGADLVLTDTVLNSDFFLAIGRGSGTAGHVSTGTLTNSTVTTGSLSLAYDNGVPGYTATAILTLNDSNYTTSVFNRIGESGGGTGSLVLNGSSTMTSGLTNIGQELGSNGTLNIKGTSLYTSNGRLHVGSGAGSAGNLIIEGSGSMIVNSYVSVGFEGGGSMTVRDDATFSNNDDFSVNENGDAPATVTLQDNGAISAAGSVFVGRFTGRVGTLTQTGGTFTGGGNEFQIGRDGQGSWLQSGGVANAGGWVSVGRYPDGTGVLSVSGTGTFIQTGTDRGLMIGEGGTGTLNIQGTGTVSSLGSVGVLVSNEAGATGTVNLDGGTLSALNVRDGGGSSTFHFNGGVLKAGAGASLNFLSGLDTVDVKAGGATIDSNGQTITIAQDLLDGTGGGGLTKTGAGTLTLTGANTYQGNTSVSAGTLRVSSAYLADASTVNIASGGAKMYLDFAGNDTVASLILGGVPMGNGTYNGTTHPAYFDAAGTGSIVVGASGSAYDTWAGSFGLDPETDGAPGEDADDDGQTNSVEFGFGGNPINGSNNAKIHALKADSDDGGSEPELLMTVAVRSGMPAFSAGSPATASFEGANYSIEGSVTLGSFATGVTPVAPVSTGLPSAPAGYEYRTFSLDGSNGLPGRGFLRATISQ